MDVSDVLICGFGLDGSAELWNLHALDMVVLVLPAWMPVMGNYLFNCNVFMLQLAKYAARHYQSINQSFYFRQRGP